MEIKDLLLYGGILWIVGATAYFFIKRKLKEKNSSVLPGDVISYKAPVQVNLVIDSGDDFDTSVFSTMWFTMSDIREMQKAKAEELSTESKESSDPTFDKMLKYTSEANDDSSESGKENELKKEQDEADAGISINDWDEEDGNDARENEQEQKNEGVRKSVDQYYDITEHFKQ